METLPPRKSPITPTRIDKYSPTEMLVDWSTGESFAIPFTDLRFHCPCAGCVNENTGERMIRRSDVKPDVRPLGVQLIGRYALQISWSDQHATGMYSFDALYDLCRKNAKAL